jgi:preprotein translocase subunit SecG
MTTLFIIIHIFVCIALIMIVLLQTGKGAEMGAAFGGASQTLFGGAGPAPFLSKITTVAAIVFMLTSLSLAYFSAKPIGGSIMEDVAQEALPFSEETLPADAGSAPMPVESSDTPPSAQEVPLPENPQ